MSIYHRKRSDRYAQVVPESCERHNHPKHKRVAIECRNTRGEAGLPIPASSTASHRLLHHCLMQMMATLDLRLSILKLSRCGKRPLPSPLAISHPHSVSTLGYLRAGAHGETNWAESLRRLCHECVISEGHRRLPEGPLRSWGSFCGVHSAGLSLRRCGAGSWRPPGGQHAPFYVDCRREFPHSMERTQAIRDQPDQRAGIAVAFFLPD